MRNLVVRPSVTGSGSPRSGAVMMTGLLIVFFMVFLAGAAGADPLDPFGRDEVAPRLPVVVPTASNWQPKFPFPFDQTRGQVTDADINAERDMCQWFNEQYSDLRFQIERFNNSMMRRNGRWDAEGVQERADAVTANIDQSVDFLAPRAESLTQAYDHAGDMYFPIYQGQAFYRLYQHLYNVGNGIRGRQPTWFTGPSFQEVLHWGSRINRSSVCR